MEKRLEKCISEKKKYFDILGGVPDFFSEYIYTPEMQKQDKISVTSGTAYSYMSPASKWYSSLDHSIAVGTIIWHFTHNKAQALSGLFHDIATPTFKHSIDFLNKDYSKQESTEANTSDIIKNSKEIMELLDRDGILLEEVDNYHKYPIADNDSPKLSADRLEYTFSNSLGVIKSISNLDEIKSMYDDLVIGFNEEGKPELSFSTTNKAEKFVSIMSELSNCYVSPQAKLSMQFLADIVKSLVELGYIDKSDLYKLSDENVMDIMKNCKYYNINKSFDIWRLSQEAYESDSFVTGKYCVSINPKIRYIDPLVYNEDSGLCGRVSTISSKAKEDIEKAKNYKTKKYVYSNFKY